MPNRRAVLSPLMLAALTLAGCAAQPAAQRPPADAPASEAERPFTLTAPDGRWLGRGVSYGPYRDGQRPGQPPGPTKAEIREDLRIMARHWDMLRLYGSDDVSQRVLEVIDEDGLDMPVMLGVWITAERRFNEDGEVVAELPDGVRENREQVARAIRLAADFPNIVTAVNVGNETQIWWSDHRIATDRLIAYIREVRAATDVPVTTADDFGYWTTPDSARLAAELDFIVTHIYAMWHGQQLGDAMAFTQAKLAECRAAHPGALFVIGEAGWATTVHDEGLQADLIKGDAGEPEQLLFVRAFTEWSERERIPYYYFEAFDENWKGGPHPNEVEKHWGVYRADRTPKAAVGVLPKRAAR